MSDILDLMKKRHSVRQYEEKRIDDETRAILSAYAKEMSVGGVSFRVEYDEPTAFKSLLAHYGNFRGVQNYIVCSGEENKDFEIGYYGEKIVLKAQELGLNTCWVMLTYARGKVKPDEGFKRYLVISLGYGKTQGATRKSKAYADVVTTDGGELPENFEKAVEACLLAPTAVNQQKFKIDVKDKVATLTALKGHITTLDLGIVQCHYDLATGKTNL